MTRYATFHSPERALAFGLAAVSGGAVRAQEEIKTVDHLTKKESAVPIKGVIDSESPEGIKIKVGTETKLIPAADIKYVLYKLGATVKGYEYNGPFGKETKALDPATKQPERLKLLGGGTSGVRGATAETERQRQRRALHSVQDRAGNGDASEGRPYAVGAGDPGANGLQE